MIAFATVNNTCQNVRQALLDYAVCNLEKGTLVGFEVTEDGLKEVRAFQIGDKSGLFTRYVFVSENGAEQYKSHRIPTGFTLNGNSIIVQATYLPLFVEIYD